MTKRKSTKSALITSVLALFLCFAMLLGSTFAWFTDSAASANNIIKSGNLDMKLSFKEYGAENTEWTEVKEDTVVFGKDALYEPGYTEAVWLKVENLGSLAFRYNLAINVLNEKEGVNRDGKSFKLSDYLEVKYMVTTSTEMEENYYTTSDRLHGFNFGGVANSGVASLKEDIAMINNGVAFSKDDAVNGAYSSSYVLVIISMPETVGNEACHDGKTIPEISFSLTAMATQLAHEEDSFGSSYDVNADYIPVINTLASLRTAMEKGGEYKLGTDITVEGADMLYAADGGHSDGSAFFVKADTVIDLNGHDITVTASSAWADVFFMNFGADLTLKGDGDVSANCSIACVYDANSALNVEGGNYSVTANNDMLYAIYGKINVRGGTFTTSYWNTINIYGSGRVHLVDVSGGAFKGWNPAASPDGNLLANGYKVVSEVVDGVTWYTVVAE